MTNGGRETLQGIEDWVVSSIMANTWHETHKRTNSHERKNSPWEAGHDSVHTVPLKAAIIMAGLTRTI